MRKHSGTAKADWEYLSGVGVKMAQDQFEIEEGVLIKYLGTDPEIRIPEGIHTIGEGALKGMASLQKVMLPSSLKQIDNGAFKGCRQLKEIFFPEGLTKVGEYAFHRCHALEEVIFPKTMQQIGNYAFLYCDGLKKAVIEGPERLGDGVFSHNLSLREIALHSGIDDGNFSAEVFEGCVNLRKISLSGEVYEIENLIEAMDSHTSYPGVIRSIAKSVYHSLQIEDGVLSRFNINLKTVDLPEGLTSIGKACFFDKKGIVRITLPKSLQEIRSNAFLNCISLEEITFQNEMVKLDEKAFRGCCNLKVVRIKDQAYSLEEGSDHAIVGSIRDQVLGDFLISGKILIRYMGNEEQVQIPRGVEIIGERCFFGKEQLKTVLCPEGLTEIREQAFAGCLTLQNVVLPETLKRVEREAFAECKKLLKCNLPKDLESIGEYAFRRCMTLRPFEPWPADAKIHPYAFYKASFFAEYEKKSPKAEEAHVSVNGNGIAPYAYAGKSGGRTLTLKDIMVIGKYAYAGCPDLEEIEIDAPECVIEANAFATCPRLKKVILHVKQIGKAAFSYCRNLEEVQLAGVSVLPQECFAGCYKLQELNANGITQIEARCFDECIHLRSFDFSKIRRVGERAFERCDSLQQISLDQVECAFHAFADCASLQKVELTGNTILKSGAFIGCTRIREIVYDGHSYTFSRFSDSLNHINNPYPMPVREVIASVYSCFDIREKKILYAYSQDATGITIPEDIEEIGADVFRDHSRLAEIGIPQTVKRFGSHAFLMTGWLEEQRKKEDMVIVNGVLIDGAMCKGSVTIPLDAARIASWCFAGNIDITELRIPSERIAIEALSFRNCLNLKKIIDWDGTEYTLSDVSDLKSKDYPDLIGRIFSECINCFKLDEENNLVESTGNITRLTFPQGIRAVGDGVYKDCHLLESIVLSEETERIGRSAFENSKWLQSVQNAKAIREIGAQAFSGCASLERIDLSDALTEMGKRCFEHCASLSGIHLSKRMEKIPERAFFRCKSLKKLVIPSSVKEIETEAFAFCSALEEVTIPKETQVAADAFAFCDRVKITITGGDI